MDPDTMHRLAFLTYENQWDSALLCLLRLVKRGPTTSYHRCCVSCHVVYYSHDGHARLCLPRERTTPDLDIDHANDNYTRLWLSREITTPDLDIRSQPHEHLIKILVSEKQLRCIDTYVPHCNLLVTVTYMRSTYRTHTYLT